jgi:hypothetical protein
MMKWWPWVILGISVLFMKKDTAADRSNAARGIRNNNPGNLRKGQNWSGRIIPGTDPAFDQFKTMSYGIRALFIDLINKHKSGLDTIQEIIYKYAPPSENITASYVSNVAARSGIPATAVFPPTKDNFMKIAKAMVRSENGPDADLITSGEWNSGWTMAMQRKDIASYIVNA